MTQTYDVLVVGAGIFGATTAIKPNQQLPKYSWRNLSSAIIGEEAAHFHG